MTGRNAGEVAASLDLRALDHLPACPGCENLQAAGAVWCVDCGVCLTDRLPRKIRANGGT